MAQDRNTLTHSILAMGILAILLVGTSTLVFGGQWSAAPSATDSQVLPATGYDYYSVVLATNPLGYFHFDTLTQGSAVGGYTVTFVGNATVGTPSAPLQEKNNKALIVPGGGSDYITTSLMGGIPGTGSMVAWVYLKELPSVKNRYFYISGESQYGNDFDLQFQSDNRLYFYTGAGENTAYAPKVETLLKRWHMIAVTYVGGYNGFRNIYWDGALVAPYSGGVSGGSKVNQFTVGYSLVFGSRDFQGNIDDVGVWNYALTTEQISAMWKACHRTVTATTLTPSLNPSTYGQAVTFTALVVSKTGPPPDGEAVTFQKGTTVLGTGTLTDGSATFTISALPVTANAIKAVYDGDSDFAASTSKVVSQVVSKATTTTALASSQNPANVGQSVTFTASVTPQFSGTVKGTVTFYDGTTALKTMSLSGGVAKLTTKTLTSGTHSITATYNGSTTFIGSSASLTQTVN